MSTYKHNLIVFIGRFQPFHIGHREVVQDALQHAQSVLILIGSSDAPRTSKNPWLYEERREMIYASLSEDEGKRVFTAPLHDESYNDPKWVASVQQHVRDFEIDYGFSLWNHGQPPEDGPKKLDIRLIGHTKDETSYYLKLFPQWKTIEHEMNEVINATDVRALMYEGKTVAFLSGVCAPAVVEQIIKFRETEDFAVLQREYEMVKKYHKAWAAAPYAPTFVTTDAVVIQSGHILLIQRDAAPGEGLWALPGGFLEQKERIEDGVFRELREETKLKVPLAVLKGSIKKTHVFDRPDRSLRGRTITHAYLIELAPGELPPVKGSDDARRAKWVPIASLDRKVMFEDHFHIINYFLGL